MPAEETRIDGQSTRTQKRYSHLDSSNEEEMWHKINIGRVCNRGKSDAQVY